MTRWKQTEGRTESGEAVTKIMLETFRLNGALLAAGDRITEPFGLTSSRWQVLGAIWDDPATVSDIARIMGLTRQSVQRTVNALERDGFVELVDNPSHKRARLVRITHKGHETLVLISRQQVVWANGLADGISPDDLQAALKVIRTIEQRINQTEVNNG